MSTGCPRCNPAPVVRCSAKLLGLPTIEAQKEGRDDGPQANTTLNAAVLDPITQADTVDDLWVVLDVLERGNRCDVQMRVPLVREHASVAFAMNMSPSAAAASAFWEGKPWMCSTSAALRD